MRTRIPASASRLAEGLFVSALLWVPGVYGQAALQPQSISVVYTGALYGYYRDDAPTFSNPSGLVGGFIARHAGPDAEHPNRKSSLLLGLGDNFGPEFGASIQEENRSGCPMMRAKSEEYPQALYKDDLRVAPSTACDNVGNFLVKAGYRAIVPGREDFMYGAGWLREMAANMRVSGDAANIDKRLTMLAANLRIKFQSESDSSRNASGKFQNPCPLFFASNNALFGLRNILKAGQADDTSSEPATCSSQTAGSPPELLDVLARMTLVMNNPEIEASLNQTTDVSSAPSVVSGVTSDIIQHRNQIIFNQLDQLRLMSWGLAGTGGLLKEISQLQKRLNGTGPMHINSDEIRSLRDCVASLSEPATRCPAAPGSGGSAANVTGATPGQTQPSCTFAPLSTQDNLADLNGFAEGLLDVLQNVCSSDAKPGGLSGVSTLIVNRKGGLAGIRALLRAIAREQWNTGYTITPTKPTGTEHQTLIIGVVGDSTLQDVSLFNRQFCFSVTADNKPGTVTYDYCHRNGDRDRHADLQAQVYMFDPVETIVALLRAAKLTHPDIQSVVVMAQMPHTEAEELGAALQKEIAEMECVVAKPCAPNGTSENGVEQEARGASTILNLPIPSVDFILSEAQDDHASGDLQISFSGSGAPAPVLTPRHAYRALPGNTKLLSDPASVVTYMRNTVVDSNSPDLSTLGSSQQTTSLGRTGSFTLHNEELNFGPGIATSRQASVLLAQKLLAIPEDDSPDPESPYAKISLGKLRNGDPLTVGKLLRDAQCGAQNITRTIASSCALAIQRLLMQMLQRGARVPGDPLDEYFNHAHELTDVSLLEERDLWLDGLPEGYARIHDYCRRWLGPESAPPAGSQSSPLADCELRVALDIVAWKGDTAYRALVKGSDLTDMIATAQKLSSGEQSLSVHDTTGEWLVTFGLEQKGGAVLTGLVPRATALWMVNAPDCVDNDNTPPKAQSSSGSGATSGAQSASDSSQYCVNGKTIQTDASYWVATSDHLIQDEQVYDTLAKLPDPNKEFTGCYLTEKIAQAFHASAHLPYRRHCSPGHTSLGASVQRSMDDENAAGGSAPNGSAEAKAQSRSEFSPLGKTTIDIQATEDSSQLRRLFHMEFGKIVAGYDVREAVHGDSFVANNFQGVTDSRASAASQRELDIEQQMRGYFRSRRSTEEDRRLFGIPIGTELRVGFQSDLEFDRSAQGNLAGKAVNPTFPLNSVSGGIFVERDFYPNSKATDTIAKVFQWIPPVMMAPGRFAMVYAPRQYQRQIVGSYLYFPFSSTAGGGGPKNNFELTVPTQPTYGFSERLGIRETATTPDLSKKLKEFLWDSGSYSETGFQYLFQRRVLQALTIATPDSGKAPLTCDATGTLTFANCAKQITIDNTSTFSNLVYADPTALGVYWDISLQKQLSPVKDQIHKVGLQLSSKGDRLITRHLPLSTETRWDAPLSAALTFQILPNLSVAPTYNGFWYSNQVLDGHLFINEGLITLRWYFNRDSMSPFGKQVLFNGPASDDQTKSMHIKGGSLQ